MKIYQSFYKPEQISQLDIEFIPYNNLKNEVSDFREYPLLLDLYSKNRDYGGYWGLVSPLFKQKTKMNGITFKNLITSNPGYDVYHINPFPQIADSYLNPFVQGNDYHHPGMIDYINNLMRVLNYNLDISSTKFAPEHFMYCSYYVGNSKFWNHWIAFAQTCIFVSEKNENLKSYLYGKTSIHDGVSNFFNFSFVVERLVGLFAHLNSNTIKVLGFTCK